ncbi:hypothetical protein [Alteribacter aurantiacus]|uniref:hypothetical protein n=1 Tax=Alteribacter aurantiacus TaxID=254410 RepID=UPI000427EC39|nr:hypothetical protein [Alteribacter aurantiacus]
MLIKRVPPLSFFYLAEETGEEGYIQKAIFYLVPLFAFLYTLLALAFPASGVNGSIFGVASVIWIVSMVVGYIQSGKKLQELEGDLREARLQRKKNAVTSLYTDDEEVVEKWVSMERPTHYKSPKVGAGWHRTLTFSLFFFTMVYFPIYHVYRSLNLRDKKLLKKSIGRVFLYSVMPISLIILLVGTEEAFFLILFAVSFFLFLKGFFSTLAHALAHHEEIVLSIAIIFLLNSRKQYINSFDEKYMTLMTKIGLVTFPETREDI